MSDECRSRDFPSICSSIDLIDERSVVTPRCCMVPVICSVFFLAYETQQPLVTGRPPCTRSLRSITRLPIRVSARVPRLCRVSLRQRWGFDFQTNRRRRTVLQRRTWRTDVVPFRHRLPKLLPLLRRRCACSDPGSAIPDCGEVRGVRIHAKDAAQSQQSHRLPKLDRLPARTAPKPVPQVQHHIAADRRITIFARIASGAIKTISFSYVHPSLS